MKNNRENPSFHTAKQQMGATLIEVLVSMLVLALGIMALLAMQVRTTASIKEAENLTIVAQATQNLAEQILTNPILELDTSKKTVANYDHYKISGCKSSSPAEVASIKNTNRDETAKEQLKGFCITMEKMQGVELDNVRVSICRNDTMEEGTFTNLCTPGGADTAVKVAWKMETSDDESKDLDIDSSGNITYFYQVPLVR